MKQDQKLIRYGDISIRLQPDGAISVDGMEDQDVLAWLEKHNKHLTIAIANDNPADLVAMERKACADLVYSLFEDERLWENRKDGGDVLTAAIRARGQK